MNLVIGTTYKLSKQDVIIFLKSLERVADSKIRVALFTEEKNNDLKEHINSDITEFVYRQFSNSKFNNILRGKILNQVYVYKALKYALPRYVLLKLVCGSTNIMVRRFIYYYLYLKKNYSKFSNVLLTDIRDVYWQKSIFDSLIKKGLYVYLEDDSVVIGNENDNNIKWIKNVFGSVVAKETNKLLGKVSSCAGIVIGDTSSIILYLESMIDIILKYNSYRYGDDQAIHNYIVYNNLVTSTIVNENNTGLVFTMCNVEDTRIKYNQKGEIVNDLSIPYCLLHHYDRFDSLKQMLITNL